MANSLKLESSDYHKLRTFVATTTLSLILTALLPVLLLLFGLYYILVMTLAYAFRPDLSVVSGLSAWLATEPVYSHPSTNIVVHLICEANISVEELRRKVEERVIGHTDPGRGLIYNRLRCKWTSFMGYLFWEPESNFDLNHHVRLYDYNDEPGLCLSTSSDADAIGCTEETLVRITGKLCTRRYKDGTSPWELLLIPNYKSSERDIFDHEGDRNMEAPSTPTRRTKTVLCLRIHHALADGYSVMGLLCHLMQHPLPSDNYTLREKVSLLMKASWRELSSLLLLPVLHARYVVETFDQWHAWHPQQKQLCGENISFCSGRIPWSYFRAIMRKYGVSSSAAVYAVTSEAVVRLMKEAGIAIPKDSITAVVPLPKLNHPGGLVNHLLVTYYRFNPRVHSGAPLVRHIGKSVRRLHEGNRIADMTGWIFKFLSIVPTCCVHLASKHSGSATLHFSNFAAPQTVLDTTEVRWADCIACVGHDPGTAIMGMVVSILGSTRIVLNVDRSIFEGTGIPAHFSRQVAEVIRDLLVNATDDTGARTKQS